jgi:hypothetical protein
LCGLLDVTTALGYQRNNGAVNAVDVRADFLDGAANRVCAYWFSTLRAKVS